MKQPNYLIGDTIVNSLYMGTIKSAFFKDGKWNYAIGENAVNFDDMRDGYKVGDKFIVEDTILWWCGPNDEKLKEA